MAVKTETIVFGGGCFWCTEAVFKMLKGVIKTMPGYAGGNKKNPTYEEVCSGDTGHAEVLQIEYDPKVVGFEKLLDVFFSMHDPTTPDRQGNDTGSQYRSVILYSTDEQHKAAEQFIKKLQTGMSKVIVTELRKLDAFYPAENYHRDYFGNNPLQPYCMFVVRPKVDRIKKEFSEDLKKE